MNLYVIQEEPAPKDDNNNKYETPNFTHFSSYR